jgi:hypothetical protein
VVILPATSNNFLAPLPGKKKTSARGVSHAHPLLCFKFCFILFLLASFYQKPKKKLVSLIVVSGDSSSDSPWRRPLISIAIDPSALDGSLDPSFSQNFSSKVRSSFSTTVHPPSGSDGFHLIVAFGHAKFRLDTILVNSALRSSIGSHDADFHVIHIRERVFRFSVISKVVGFMVYNLKSFSCPSFACHFFLWGSGGPNWS